MDIFTNYPYSQTNPSQRYQDLLVMYKQLHADGIPAQGIEAEKTFPGLTAFNYAEPIRQLIEKTASTSLLDYGCGKGQQYKMKDLKMHDGNICPSLQHFWGIEQLTCYDPAYPEFTTIPQGTYDGVICTDVLEHCPEEDMPWILDTLFSYSRKFVFATVACYPAKKSLPNGENAHITIRPFGWWQQLLTVVANRHPGRLFEIHIQYDEMENGALTRKNTVLTPAPGMNQQPQRANHG